MTKNKPKQKRRKLTSTALYLAIGVLCGGLLGLGAGSFFHNESIVILCYTVGAVAGVFLGNAMRPHKTSENSQRPA